MSLDLPLREIAHAVRTGRVTAGALAEEAIARIRATNPSVLAVTRLLEDRAREATRATDARIAAGEATGPLAGVPFGVKDLFDVARLPNSEGAALRLSAAPARTDAEAVRRLVAAGATPIATLNMDAHAYGFATINAHYGTTRNPHDLTRLAGGSSGGSAAAVAAGMIPATLGSDTNGSIRVPAALCGVYGLKPTHGTLPMAGVAPFAESFDDIGPLAARLDDLRLLYEILSGTPLPSAPPRLRVGRLTGWFARNLSPAMASAMDRVAAALDAMNVDWPHVAAARSAAFLMTAAEGGSVHARDLRDRPLDFDPQVRDRLIAGTTVPLSAYRDAKRFQAWFRARVAECFERFDVLLAPAVPGAAPTIEDPVIELDGASVPARAHLGVFTQPVSFVGLPVLAVPLLQAPGALPLGLQLIGAPGAEATLFALARRMEDAGLIGSDRPGVAA